MMQTTLSIDDDVLTAARKLALANGRSIGAVISDLARQSLRRSAAGAERNGISLLPVSQDAAVVTRATVNALRDDWTWRSSSLGRAALKLIR